MWMSGRFAALWGSQAASNTADGILAAAAPLLMAALTRDPLAVATMTVVQFLPWILFTLPAGAIADRVDRRSILVTGNVLRALGLTLLGVSVALGWQSIWLLYCAILITGTAETLVDNAALTVPPRLVPRARLEAANGRLLATQNVVNTFVGPPVGSMLMAVAASLAFLTSAGLFAVAAALALLLPRLMPGGPTMKEEDAGSSGSLRIREGWSHFWHHSLLRRVAFISAAINLCGSATAAVLVLMATGPLGVDPRWYGAFIAVPAAGAILGALLAETLVPRIGGGPVTWAAALLPAASYLLIGLTRSAPVALATMFIAAVATACNQIVVSTLRQASVPDPLLGRVTAAYRLVVLGTVPLGALVGGVVSRVASLEVTYVVAGGGLVLAAVVLAPPVTTAALRAVEVREHADAP